MNFAQDHCGVVEIVRMIAGGSAQAQNLIAVSHARAAAVEPDLRAFTYLPSKPPIVSAGMDHLQAWQ